ncbi:MAG: hypothetical protein JXQ72_04370, partial [Anaerolineae bacterium]|nr:hypothetical protein [Anaerolineae bacterium]
MKDNLNTLRAIFFAVIVTGIVGVLTVIAARIGGGGDPIPAAANATTSSSQAAAPAVPDAVPGEQVPIPLGKDLIALDGDLADWAALPVYRVDWGTQPNGTPTTNPYYEFSVAADGEYFYFMATMPDDMIVVGEDGHNWNGDSVEFSLNLTGDLLAAEYREGIFQVRIDPRHLNNTDPADFGLEGE